jgi:hypothetical protein
MAGKPVSSPQSPPGNVKYSEEDHDSRGAKRQRFEGKSPNRRGGKNKGKNMGPPRRKEVGRGQYLYVIVISTFQFFENSIL